jgi:hypothetical protein
MRHSKIVTSESAPSKPKRRRRRKHALESLPFVTVDYATSELNLWAAKPTGDYSTDEETGKRFAVELISYMRYQDIPFVLTQVVKAVVASQKWTGIEVGFCNTFSRIAMCR